MKTYIVTGAASGIGLRIVQDLLKNGSKVGVIDVKELPPELREASDKQELIYVQGSSSDESKVRDTIRRVREKWRRLDGVINNVGKMVRKPLQNLSLDEWNEVIATNLTSAFLFARESTPLLKESHGTILNISSTRAYQSEKDTESYSATKGGLVALTHALAISLGPDIRVNCISPGWIDSRPPEEQANEPLKKTDHDQHPVGRVGRTEDVSNLVQWLLSEKSGFITGQDFIIDGGMTRKMIYEE